MSNVFSNVVLPDTLVAQLIDNAANLSGFLQKDFESISSQRASLRSKLVEQHKIIHVDTESKSLERFYAIDGAHLAEIDRASAYSVSCSVRVSHDKFLNSQSSCLSILPHVASLNTLSSGLMMIQEIMMAVNTIENDPDAICLIDGSRISAIININSFYSGLQRDMPDQLRSWRELAKQEPLREPGNTINLFESRDWLTPFLTSPQIVGNLKLVTTTSLISQYIPTWEGRFDDKTFAALVLDKGEALEPISLPSPDDHYHINSSYPFYRQINNRGSVGDQIVEYKHPNQLFHFYYRPDDSHGVFKLEFNRTLLDQPILLKKILTWWRKEVQSPDLQEPYSFYIADKFAKEAVSVAKNALKEITRRGINSATWAWFFTQPYRTE